MQQSSSELALQHFVPVDSLGEPDSETKACLVLRSLPKVGDSTIRHLVETFGSATNALSQVQLGNARSASGATIDSNVSPKLFEATDYIVNSAKEAGARILGVTHPEYPCRLRELHDPPAAVFVRGTMESTTPPAVAIVGTRNASGYGLRVAKAIATSCARAGITVISGLARGIDGAAHEAALANNGRTTAVLGTGIDIAYPRSHRALQERIAFDGLVISELNPGDTGHAGTFPRRNRIIAALADITVVVEAGTGSGALITADHALELGRTVACVPNAIDVSSAKGSNALLKAHAEPLLSAEDVISLLGLTPTPPQGPALDGLSAACWDAVHVGNARTAAQVANIAGVSLREANATLSLLEIDGLITVESTGHIVPAVFPT